MGKGFLRVEAAEAAEARYMIRISDIYGNQLYELHTEGTIDAKTVAVDTPDASHTITSEDTGPYFTLVDAEITHAGSHSPTVVRNIPIFDSITSVLPVTFTRQEPDTSCEIVLPPVFGLQMPHEQPGCMGEQAAKRPTSPGCMGEPYVKHGLFSLPETVVVHTGRPGSKMPDVCVPFKTYIKTAAACEIYPTWPEAAVEANILCLMSVALHRINSGWYRKQGYPFDITASVSFDPFYVHHWPLFDNVSAIVDRVWGMVPMLGHHPFVTPYCNGTTSACPGFSQWGSVALAQEGASALEILRHYFGPEIQLASITCPTDPNAPVKHHPQTTKSASPCGAALCWMLIRYLFFSPARPAPAADYCVR